MRMLPVLRVWGLVFIVCVVLSLSAIAQSPGDIVGYSGSRPNNFYYGENQIEIDTSGGLHFAWMDLSNYPNRNVRYNYRDHNGNWVWPGIGETPEFRSGAGYPELAVLADGRAVIAAHTASTGSESVYVARDLFAGIGQFEFSHLRFYSNPNPFIWPRVCIDHAGRIHLLATQTENSGQVHNIGYRMSSNEGMTWTAIQIAGQSYTLEAMIVASEISNKVAIIFKKPFGADSHSQNISYVQSADGLTWDFENGVVDITDYGTDADSLRPIGQLDAVYDANDNLHIVWTARQIVNGITDLSTYLYHFENGDGRIREIASRTPTPTPYCNINLVNSIDQPTIAIRQNTNKVVVSYVGYYPTDCDIDSIPNGDIFLQWSENFGEDWSAPINITNSPTPGCSDGNCASDVNPSLAKDVNNYAHLMYACDNRQSSRYLYYSIPVSGMGVPIEGKLPQSFTIDQNYPNPFNAVTTIEFQLSRRDHINISVYDVTGARIATLMDDYKDAGNYSVKWDAGEMTSGVYFCRAEAGGKTFSKKMILLK
jgi:hypothetical protein